MGVVIRAGQAHQGVLTDIGARYHVLDEVASGAAVNDQARGRGSEHVLCEVGEGSFART